MAHSSHPGPASVVLEASKSHTSRLNLVGDIPEALLGLPTKTCDRVAARAHLMKSSAMGLKVRFFKVKIATGLVCTPRSIGKP